MSKDASFDFSFSKLTPSFDTQMVTVSINLNNDSSVGLRSAEISVKDNDSGAVQTARFGPVQPRSRVSQSVSLPGYADWAAWKIVIDTSGEEHIGFGYADNAPVVNLNLSD